MILIIIIRSFFKMRITPLWCRGSEARDPAPSQKKTARLGDFNQGHLHEGAGARGWNSNLIASLHNSTGILSTAGRQDGWTGNHSESRFGDRHAIPSHHPRSFSCPSPISNLSCHPPLFLPCLGRFRTEFECLSVGRACVSFLIRTLPGLRTARNAAN